MVLPCGPVFFPTVTPRVHAVLHAIGRARSHIGHHVVHHVRHAVHAMGTHPAAVIGFACRTAPGWTAAGLLALPLLPPLHPAPAQLPATAPSESRELQGLGGATPLPVRQSFGTDGTAEGSAGTTSALRAANVDIAAIADQAVPQPLTPASLALASLPLLPAQAPATRPYSLVPLDKIPRDFAPEFPDTPQAVPEPSSMLVLTTGFYGLKWIRRRRQPLVRSRT